MGAPPGLLPDLIERVYNSDDHDRYTSPQGFGFASYESVDTRTKKARSWIFLEAFERYFGRRATRQRLQDAIQFVESRDATAQYLSPADYQSKFQDRFGGAPVIPLPPYGQSVSSRDRFLWYLRYTMPGCYWWAGGRSATFTQWLNTTAPAGGFPPYSTINCWEMVFLAAIKAGFLSADQLKPVYVPAAKDSEVLKEIFGPRMTKYNPAKEPLPTFEAGDIVVADLEDFHHVFAIVDGNTETNNLNSIQLYSQGFGAGVTFYLDVADVLDIGLKSSFSVLKL